jgi:hypothetical protein
MPPAGLAVLLPHKVVHHPEYRGWHAEPHDLAHKAGPDAALGTGFRRHHGLSDLDVDDTSPVLLSRGIGPCGWAVVPGGVQIPFSGMAELVED